jgi:hypothetical protein
MFQLNSWIPPCSNSSFLPVLSCRGDLTQALGRKALPQPLAAKPATIEARSLAPRYHVSLGEAGEGANASPEVTHLFCRLPLSTFNHRLEAVSLGDRMRLSVRPGMRAQALTRLFFEHCMRSPQRPG